MIIFFRKIRQRVLTESKFIKYSLYAIGEIILVVIGILIALQVNEWREQKRNKAWETYYLSRLAEDLNGHKSGIEWAGNQTYKKVR